MTRHSFTVDVEDWYHGALDRQFRETSQSRLRIGLDAILDLLSAANTKATFFWLGAAARENPSLLRKVVALGHEIGCHGDEHIRINKLKPAEMLLASKNAKQELEEIAGRQIFWYRAPYFSLPYARTWGAEVLLEAGFTHDSSVLAGVPCAWSPTGLLLPTELRTPSGTLIEVPVTAYRIVGRSIAVTGGGVFRLAPYRLTKAIISREGIQGRAANFYVHPWELDRHRPKCELGRFEALRNSIGRSSTHSKLERLLTDFAFEPLGATVRAFYSRSLTGSAAADSG